MSSVLYVSATDSLKYSMICTRPNITYVTSMICRFMADMGKEYWRVVKWIFRYLRGSYGFGLSYIKENWGREHISGFVDSDYARDLDKHRSLTWYVCQVYGNIVSWKFNFQSIVAL